MTAYRLVHRAAPTDPLMVGYLLGPHNDDALRAALPGASIVTTAEAPTSVQSSELDAARRLAVSSPDAPLVLVGYSAGCQPVRALLLLRVLPAAVVTIDGTHASMPPATWQIDVWRELAAQARRGELVWVATCTQQLYTERLPVGQRFTATRHVIERAVGQEFPAGAELHEGGLHVVSYASADIDAAAHVRQQREVLPAMLKRHIEQLCLAYRRELPTQPEMATSLASRSLAAALHELAAGVREEPLGSNTGPRIREYLRLCERGGRPVGMTAAEWCAAFASWCLERSLGPNDARPHRSRISVAELWADAVDSGCARSSDVVPMPGWLAIYGRSGGDPRKGGIGHVGRVELVDGERYTTIDGNHLDRVSQVNHRLGDALGWIAYPGDTRETDAALRARVSGTVAMSLDKMTRNLVG